MLIFKIMVCFLAVFSGEDCVGGLPTVPDSSDNVRTGQSVRSASNQVVLANEAADIRPGDSIDSYVERNEEDVAGKVTGEILTSCEKENEDQRRKFVSQRASDGNNLRDESWEGYSGTDRCKPVLDKSKSRKDQVTTTTESQDAAQKSRGDNGTRRFSSVYVDEDLRKKMDEKKEDVLEEVVSEKSTGQDLEDEAKTSATLLSERTNVPGPEEETISRSVTSEDEMPLENRQRKSLSDVIKWQQSTNMRPTRTQYLVQNKRSTSEGSLKLPGNGGRRNFARNFRVNEPLRRQFDTRNNIEFAPFNPVQINAAVAYSKRPTSQQALNIDLSKALYQFGPAQLHALRGVFDKVPPSTKNFKPIAPKEVAYVAPRIVYDAKIVPTPFMPFRTEQKTVDALSALLGQNPAQQLQGLNLILRKDRPEETKSTISPGAVLNPEISRQGINNVEALRQAFVTPIPSADVNSGLGDGPFGFINGGVDLNEEIRPVIETPFNHKTADYPIREIDGLHRENGFKTIPIVEHQDETSNVREEELPGWNEGEGQEASSQENEGRYHQYNQESNHGESYAAKYNFGYHVKDYESGNNFGHEESRDGVITNGRYHVLLPDGRIQNVKYHVDEGGYHAKVSYQLQNNSHR